jgi:hypothetical protein
MGLAEKRVLEEFKKTYNEKMLPQLKSSTPFDVEYEVVWDNIYNELVNDRMDMADTVAYFTEVFLTPTVTVFKSICADELGTGALKGVLKKVKFCSTGKVYSSQAYSFANNCLTVDHYRGNIDLQYTNDRIKYLTELLERML